MPECAICGWEKHEHVTARLFCPEREHQTRWADKPDDVCDFCPRGTVGWHLRGCRLSLEEPLPVKRKRKFSRANAGKGGG